MPAHMPASRPYSGSHADGGGCRCWRPSFLGKARGSRQEERRGTLCILYMTGFKLKSILIQSVLVLEPW
jgi:hypothetical protein